MIAEILSSISYIAWVVIALALLLFLPGFLLQRVLFSGKNSTEEQLALSVGLSICINILSIMAMNIFLQIPINTVSITANIIVVSLAIILFWALGKKLPRTELKPLEQTEILPRAFSLNKLQILALVLLLGAFLYLFELFSHGYEARDISGTNIALTFLAFVFFALLLFAVQYFRGRLKNLEALEFVSFFIFAVVFFYLIFFLRTINSIASMLIALIYFAIVIAMLFYKRNALSKIISRKYNMENPFIRFSFRFFLILGILILPAGILEFLITGQIDFRFHGISMLLIQGITPAVQAMLALFGIGSAIAQVPEGITLTTLNPRMYSVFIGLLCSGITSMSVFLAAFIAMALDLKTNAKRKTIIFGIGIFGTIFSNVLRITTLVLVGLFFGNSAMLLMHTNLGWILYFIWMTIFWALAFKIAK